jgi:hypothetical protein
MVSTLFTFCPPLPPDLAVLNFISDDILTTNDFKSCYKLLLYIDFTSFGVEKLLPRIHEFILLSRINFCELFSISFGEWMGLPRIHEFILLSRINFCELFSISFGEWMGLPRIHEFILIYYSLIL